MGQPSPEVAAIAAVARNGVIGDGDDIPWRIAADWARFKRLTLGHALVMGRRTYDSIGRPLPGRTTVVISRDPTWRTAGVLLARTPDEALTMAAEREPDTVWVAGGGQIYRALWARLDRLEITEVDLEPDGDVTFPAIDPADWTETDRDPHEGFAFLSYTRRRAEGGTRTLTPEGTGT